MTRCFCILLLLISFHVDADDKVFTLRVSGELVDRLPQDTELQFLKVPLDLSQYEDGDILPVTRVKLSDLPYELNPENQTCLDMKVNFWSPTQKYLFTVRLSQDLFDKPRPINILLNKPEPVLRPSASFFGFALYCVMITKRMEYYTLPRIDPGTQKFIKPVAPQITVTHVESGEVVHKAPLEIGCMGSRWWGAWSKEFPHFESLGFKHKETYRYSVEYDSGGLFPVINSYCEFTYDEWRH